MDAVKGVASLVTGFFEAHGWKLVGLAFGWYMVKDEVYGYLARKEKEAALRRARDPARVSALEGHLRVTREKQQAKAAAEAVVAR